MITTTPLPHDSLREPHTPPQVAGAYRKILLAETHALLDKADENVVLARVVGHLLLELYARRHIFGNLPFTRVAEDVASLPCYCEDAPHDDMDVFEVGRWYLDHLIRPSAFGRFPVFVVNISFVLKSGRQSSRPLPATRWKIRRWTMQIRLIKSTGPTGRLCAYPTYYTPVLLLMFV